MRPHRVVVLDVLTKHPPQMPFVDGDDVIEALAPERPDHPLGDGTQSATQIKGSTVAELGAMNSPTDMVSYRRDGEEYLLVATTRLPLVRIACADIEGQESLTQPQEPVGVPRESLPYSGVLRMANLDATNVLMLQQDGDGNIELHSYECTAL